MQALDHFSGVHSVISHTHTHIECALFCHTSPSSRYTCTHVVFYTRSGIYTCFIHDDPIFNLLAPMENYGRITWPARAPALSLSRNYDDRRPVLIYDSAVKFSGGERRAARAGPVIVLCAARVRVYIYIYLYIFTGRSQRYGEPEPERLCDATQETARLGCAETRAALGLFATSASARPFLFALSRKKNVNVS